MRKLYNEEDFDEMDVEETFGGKSGGYAEEYENTNAYEDDILNLVDEYDAEDASKLDANIQKKIDADIKKMEDDVDIAKLGKGNTRIFDQMRRYHSDDHDIAEEAKVEIVHDFEKFVSRIIKDHYPTFGKYWADLTQAGYLGIFKALQSYDPAKSQPTTYFHYYIMHEMTDFINTNVVGITSHYAQNIKKINSTISDLQQNGIDNPTNSEIARKADLKLEAVTTARNVENNANLVYYETDDFLESQISERMPGPEDTYLRDEKNNALYDAIASLPPDLSRTIKMKYGLGGYPPMSVKNIANALHTTVENVRKMAADALLQLRHNYSVQTMFSDYDRMNDDDILDEADIPIIPRNSSFEEIDTYSDKRDDSSEDSAEIRLS